MSANKNLNTFSSVRELENISKDLHVQIDNAFQRVSSAISVGDEVNEARFKELEQRIQILEQLVSQKFSSTPNSAVVNLGANDGTGE